MQSAIKRVHFVKFIDKSLIDPWRGSDYVMLLGNGYIDCTEKKNYYMDLSREFFIRWQVSFGCLFPDWLSKIGHNELVNDDQIDDF